MTADELRANSGLLPCPFCGGNATITEQEDEDGRFAAVVCWTCGAGSRQHYFYGEDAREHVAGAWNKRATHASRDAEVEALKRDAERYRELEKRAHKETAYDRYGNGAHWTIGLFSDDSRMTFAETIDAAMTK